MYKIIVTQKALLEMHL